MAKMGDITVISVVFFCAVHTVTSCEGVLAGMKFILDIVDGEADGKDQAART